MAAQVNDILRCKKCERNTHRISCLSPNNPLNSFSLSYRSPPCQGDMLSSLSYLFVHSFREQCVFWKAVLDSKVKSCCFVLCWILHPLKGDGDGVISESEFRGFAGQPLASAGWSTQGACSWRANLRECRESRHRGDRKETFRDSQRESAAIHCENCRMENKVRRKDGHNG